MFGGKKIVPVEAFRYIMFGRNKMSQILLLAMCGVVITKLSCQLQGTIHDLTGL